MPKCAGNRSSCRGQFRSFGFWLGPGLALVLALGTGTRTVQGEPGSKERPAPSLDDRLRSSLDADLLEGLGEILPPAQNPQPVPSRPPRAGTPPAVPRAGAGEDIGQADTNPLAKIERRMRAVEHRLAQGLVNGETQTAQREIAHELRQLIAQLERAAQCAGGQCAAPSQIPSQANSGKPSPPGGSKPGNNSKGGQPGETPGNASAGPQPAAESAATPGTGEFAATAGRAVETFQRRAWGNLPERVRQQLGSAAAEEFVPRYRGLIEEYFRRLAETPE